MKLFRQQAPAPAPTQARAAGGVPASYLGEPAIQIDTDAGPLWFPAGDGVMRQYLETYGTWEPELGQFLLSAARRGSTFLDIGAALGYFSRLVATRSGATRVIAVEPNPVVQPLLRMNLWGVDAEVEVIPAGFGESKGTAGIEAAVTNVGDARTLTDRVPHRAVIAVTTADDAVEGPVDLVKIDVQGYEPDVLRGMRGLIARSPGIVIALEMEPQNLLDRDLSPLEVLREWESQFTLRYLRAGGAIEATSDEILDYIDTAGRGGQATVVLTRR